MGKIKLNINIFQNKGFKDGYVMNKFPDQIIRIAIVFAVLIGIVIAIKLFAIPPELQEQGIFRTSAIERELNHPSQFAGSEICSDCHDEEYDLKLNGYHSTLSCEVCHGAALAHTEEPDEFTPDIPNKRRLCAICHTYNLSRPTGFPQINPYAHNPLEPCITCHNPHDPVPPESPRECVACHANIARTLSVSPHVKLECTTCHVTPDEHKVHPRSVRPGKPENRAFCGKCHDRGSDRKDAPKIDVSSHGQNGEKYLCWQCHYPHLPEID